MKRFTKLTLMLVVLVTGITATFAQNSVTTPDGELYLNGRNVSSPGVDVATENPDLITTGTLVPYLVIPDPVLNPTWAAGADATNTTGINSTWSWTVPATIGALNATPSNAGHYIYVNVTGAATTADTIKVKELSGASCPDATGTYINVRVVAQPTASAVSVTDGTAPLTSICINGLNGSLDVAFPTFNVTNVIDAAIPGDEGVRVRATLTFTDFVSGVPNNIIENSILNVDASGNISNADITAASALGAFTDLDSWGTYTLTVTQISDKISRKDLNAAGGYFNVNGVTGYSATYSVLKSAATGAIYHLPNN